VRLHELSIYVADKFGFALDLVESKNVRDFMVERRRNVSKFCRGNINEL